MPHFDWTINVPELLFLAANIMVFVRLLILLKEFPLHRHLRIEGRDYIIYPSGMEPKSVLHKTDGMDLDIR